MRAKLVPLVPILAVAWPAAIALATSLPPSTTPARVTPELTFTLTSGTVESVSAGVEPGFQIGGLLAQFCWPPTGGEAGQTTTGHLDVAVDGALAGSCAMTKVDAGAAVERRSTLTGQWDHATASVTFHFDGTQQSVVPVGGGGNATASSSVSLDAKGVAVSGGRAAGRARFTFTCSSTGAAISCGPAKAIGTITFTFVLGPADEAGETPQGGAVGPGDTETSAGPSTVGGGIPPVGIAALAAVALGVIGAAAVAIHRRRARTLAGAPGMQVAAVTADRLGGFEEAPGYGETAGGAAPGVSRAYESLVVAQEPHPGREQLITPAGSTAEELREDGVIKDAETARGGAGQPERPPQQRRGRRR